MEKETLHVALAGHIDHGKSTLIGRLLLETKSLPPDKFLEVQKISKAFGRETELAYLTDQLKEERQRRITIDTAEIFLKTPRRHYCLIDTPGHQEFIKNMLTGAARADAAILIIDAREGIREQTFRHAYLLKFLSIRDLIVVVNKMDAVGYDKKTFHDISQGASTILASLGWEARHMIPVSAKTGEGVAQRSAAMKWYRGPTLLKALAGIKSPTSAGFPALRLPVQDVLTIDGNPLVMGRIASGVLRREQRVRILPSGDQAVIAAIHVFPRLRRATRPLENIAVKLSPALQVKKGDIMIDAAEPLIPAVSFSGNIFWMSTERPLIRGDRLTLRCATQTLEARIEKIGQKMDPATLQILEQDAADLKYHEAAAVHCRLSSPGVLENYSDLPELGRFVVEHDGVLLGAGTVIEKYAN